MVRQGTPMEAHLMPYLVEDRQAGAGSQSYLDYMMQARFCFGGGGEREGSMRASLSAHAYACDARSQACSPPTLATPFLPPLSAPLQVQKMVMSKA